MFRSNKKSFTLLEVMIAITILTLAVGGSFALIQQTLVATSLAQSKLIAYYLAQEGIEIVKNIRDSNWLIQHKTDPVHSWKEGLTSGEWEIDYDDIALNPYLGRNLYIDGTNNFYTYLNFPSSDDVKTSFKRKIILNEIGDNVLEMKVEVSFEERGRSHTVEVTNFLHNWYGY